MTARLSPLAGRFDHTHGDEDRSEYFSPDELVRIDRHVRELISERLDDPARFSDLMSGIEPTTIYPHLQRALTNFDRACQGERIGVDAVLSALHQIQKVIRAEAQTAWGDECEAIAEREVVP